MAAWIAMGCQEERERCEGSKPPIGGMQRCGGACYGRRDAVTVNLALRAICRVGPTVRSSAAR